MFVEQRIYTLKGDYTPQDYLRLYEAEGLAIQTRHLGHLIGYFVSEIGTLNQIVHMWGYDDLADRARRRAALAQEPQWTNYLVKIRPMLQTMENRILTPTSFSPIR